MFTGWTTDATAFLAEITEDNTRESFDAQRHRLVVDTPMRALAAELEAEFGPVRVFRSHRNRRFRPDAPPYRTDTGGVAVTGGGAVLAVVLSATTLTVSAGHRMFDGGQLRRFRAAVCEEPPLVPPGFDLDTERRLTGLPRGFR
ncbi:MAG: DUF2461 domain-containing protein, partial [Pseudonocardia sp.]|nr:DUF2461 domain-containing protein [Pseudonocardia sp.]